MTEAEQDLLSAWASWDERPGDPARAAAMEDACQRVAALAGMPCTALRTTLAAERRAGLDRRTALAVALADCEKP